jgi:hypothetical protein
VLVVTWYVVSAEEAEVFRTQCFRKQRLRTQCSSGAIDIRKQRQAAVDALGICPGYTGAVAGPALGGWMPEGGVREGPIAIAAGYDDGRAG